MARAFACVGRHETPKPPGVPATPRARAARGIFARRWRAAHFSLAPVLRGEGWGEGPNASTCEPHDIATRCPLTLPSPLSTGARVLSSFKQPRLVGVVHDRFNLTVGELCQDFLSWFDLAGVAENLAGLFSAGQGVAALQDALRAEGFELAVHRLNARRRLLQSRLDGASQSISVSLQLGARHLHAVARMRLRKQRCDARDFFASDAHALADARDQHLLKDDHLL